MADATLDSELFVLIDNVPGSISRTGETPKDGFTGADHHNVAAAAFPVGTKYQVYNTGVSAGKAGYSTFTYLQVGTQNAGAVIAAKSICAQLSATVWYNVTNDPDTTVGLTNGFCAVALGAMTNDYYGWFWTGGVCPEEFVSGLGGTYPTDDSVVAVSPMALVDLAADAIGFGIVAATTGQVGFSCAGD